MAALLRPERTRGPPLLLMRSSSSRRAPIRAERAVSIIFFVSGAAGLMLEMVWLERCGLVFGNSVWSASLVLSSFMAGLALGNALAARSASRSYDRLAAYAWLEATVAVSGLALALGLPALTTVVAAVTRTYYDVP